MLVGEKMAYGHDATAWYHDSQENILRNEKRLATGPIQDVPIDSWGKGIGELRSAIELWKVYKLDVTTDVIIPSSSLYSQWRLQCLLVLLYIGHRITKHIH